jgi:non-heme chloroperoxidase
MTMFAKSNRLSPFMAAAVLVALTAPGLGQELKYKPISVQTPDGLTISAQECRTRNRVHSRLFPK